MVLICYLAQSSVHLASHFLQMLSRAFTAQNDKQQVIAAVAN